ncbi:hypothetical protein HGG74_15665 [Arthrobacter sp. E918]|uniref:Uncharacterized protein n=1 Tax=Arthrobacter mobilis TaxID=2724944 RepID=A0A7X6HF12_9MICC|nr:hypothetical protein [Arthrobacter mobilis]
MNAGGGDHTHETLELEWFLDGDHVSDDYTPDEISAEALFDRWLVQIGDVEEVPVRWRILRLGEVVPFTDDEVTEDFLSFYTWPVHAETGQKLNWLTLPVVSKGWSKLRADRGGFIQEVTGWKPSPLQRTVHMPSLLKACGWN